MAFVQSFTATQSSDGKTITIVDTSNYTANSLNQNDFVRTFIVNDADGNIINTYTLGDDTNTVSYPITTNQWQSIEFDLVGAVSGTVTDKFPFEQIYRLAYVRAISYNCGCCNSNNSFCDVEAFYQGSQYAIPIGDGVSYNANINSAYTLLTGL